MHHFTLKNGVMHAEGVDVSKLAETLCTPFYCYSTATLSRHYKVFKAAFEGLSTLVCYAVKANSNQAVLKTLAQLGAGMDVVSEGELRRARLPALRPTGSPSPASARAKAEMAYALAEDILCFNVESEPELAALFGNRRGARHRRRGSPCASIPTSMRKTHTKIATGTSENKFGIPLSRARAVYRRAASLPGIAVTGLDMHIGSQITELEPFDNAFALVADFVGRAASRRPPNRAYRSRRRSRHSLSRGRSTARPFTRTSMPKIVKRHLGKLGCRLIFEPGRLIVGNAGILVTRVLYVKKGEHKIFVIVDAAMNDLVRPTLYDAYHEIIPVRPHPAPTIVADIVGPVCETGDYLALARSLPEPQPGDLLAIMSAGAYGAVQAGTYNSRLLVPEVLVKGDDFAVIRPRGTYDQLIGLDKIPSWLG